MVRLVINGVGENLGGRGSSVLVGFFEVFDLAIFTSCY